MMKGFIYNKTKTVKLTQIVLASFVLVTSAEAQQVDASNFFNLKPESETVQPALVSKKIQPPKSKNQHADAKKVLTKTTKADWATERKITENQSYLASTRFIRQEKSEIDQLFDPNRSGSIRSQVQSGQDAIETQKARGEYNPLTEKARADHMGTLAFQAVQQSGDYQLRTSSDNAKKYADNNFSDDAKKPIAVAVIAGSLYTGRSYGFKVADSVKVVAQTKLRDRSASLALNTPIVTSGVSTDGQNGTNAYISKQITKEISASVGTKDQGNAQVQYTLSF